MRIRILTALIASLALSDNANAQEQVPTGDTDSGPSGCSDVTETDAMKAARTASGECRLVNADVLARLEEESVSNFLDYFGVGLSLTIDAGFHDRVDSARVVDGIIRVEEDSNVRAQFIGEMHFALKCQSGALLIEGRKRCDPTERSGGLFLAVQPGSDSVIEAVGAGWMWRLPDKLFDNRALNIGLGVMVDENVRILGEGLQPNATLPPGETEIRMRTTDQHGLLIVASIDIGGRED